MNNARPIKHGSTSQTTFLKLVDTATGDPITTLTFASAGLSLWYRRLGGTKTTFTGVTQTDGGAYSQGGFCHVGGGWYRVDPPDAAFATASAGVGVMAEATGATCVVAADHPLVAYDAADAAGLGLSRLDATISSRLATAGYTAPPAAAVNATAVRTELTTELGRIDAAISTRSTYAGANTAGTTTLLTEVAKIPKVGRTTRHRQIAENLVAKHVDVIVEDTPP